VEAAGPAVVASPLALATSAEDSSVHLWASTAVADVGDQVLAMARAPAAGVDLDLEPRRAALIPTMGREPQVQPVPGSTPRTARSGVTPSPRISRSR